MAAPDETVPLLSAGGLVQRSFWKSRVFFGIIGLCALSNGIALAKPVVSSNTALNSVHSSSPGPHKHHGELHGGDMKKSETTPDEAVSSASAEEQEKAPEEEGERSSSSKKKEEKKKKARGGKSDSVRPGQKRRHHGASATVRGRSAFTCVLCIIAAMVILLPRLACGAEDATGVSIGPGILEDLLSKEFRKGSLLLFFFLFFGIPLDLTDRLLVRGGLAYPLTLSAVQLCSCALLGFALSRRLIVNKQPQLLIKWREYGRIYVPLGICFALSIAVAHEATRSSDSGPRIANAFNVAQGFLVLILELARRQYVEYRSTPVEEAVSGRFDEPLLLEPMDEEEHEEDEVPECDCNFKMDYPPGGAGSILALLVVFGGAVIMALGEAEVGPTSALFVVMLALGQLSVAFYYVGMERRFRKVESRDSNATRMMRSYFTNPQQPQIVVLEPSVGLYLATPVSALILVVLAVFLELTPLIRLGVSSKSPSWKQLTLPEYGGNFGGWILAANIACFSASSLVGLHVIKRFSALTLVIFVLVRSIICLFVASIAFSDVVTSLEYKGVMVSVLGLVLLGLEVSKAMLQPNSSLALAYKSENHTADSSIDANSLAPSAFLEGEAAAQARSDRQRSRRRRPHLFDPTNEPRADVSLAAALLTTDDGEALARRRLDRGGFSHRRQHDDDDEDEDDNAPPPSTYYEPPKPDEEDAPTPAQ